MSTDSTLEGNSIKPRGMIASVQECDRLVSCVSLSWRRLNFLGTKGFLVVSLSYLSSHRRKGGKRTREAGWPSGRFTGLDKPFSQFPTTERYPSEFSQGCKYPRALSFFRGPADQSLDFQITTCSPRAPENESWRDSTQAFIKLTARAVHCLA